MRPAGDHTEFLAFARRVVRAASRRAGSADPADVAELIGLADDLDAAIVQAVKALRSSGFSWADLAREMGVTRQAVHARYASRIA